MTTLILPQLFQVPSPNYSSRNGTKTDLIVCHDCEGEEGGSINYFAQTKSQVSAHLVLSNDGTRCTQMVAFRNKAWHVCDYNSRSEGLEMAGYAAKGFGAPEWASAAAIIAYRLKANGLPCRWAEGGVGPGFCSHHDLGPRGGGHTDPCGVGDPTWQAFVRLVEAAYALDMPNSWVTSVISAPPAASMTYVPSTTTRHDLADGTLEWAQMRLNALGFAKPPLIVDGIMGYNTEKTVAAFQGIKHLLIDGDPGVNTMAALKAA